MLDYLLIIRFQVTISSHNILSLFLCLVSWKIYCIRAGYDSLIFSHGNGGFISVSKVD